MLEDIKRNKVSFIFGIIALFSVIFFEIEMIIYRNIDYVFFSGSLCILNINLMYAFYKVK